MGISKEYFQERLAGRGGTPRYRRIQIAIQSFKKYTVKPERLLDIGCDDGSIAVAIKEAIGTKEVYGIEIFDKSQQLALSRGVKCTRMNLDKERFPFPDEYFDIIFCGEVIEHVFDTDKIPVGIFCLMSLKRLWTITTPNLESLIYRIILLFGYQSFRTSFCHHHAEVIPIIKRVHNPYIGFSHSRCFLDSLKSIILGLYGHMEYSR